MTTNQKVVTVSGIAITPIADVTVTRERKPPQPGPWAEHVEQIASLESQAAQFVVTHVGDDLAKFKRAFRRDARLLGHTAVFGDDHPAKGGTQVQVKLVPKRVGRPRVQNVLVDPTPESGDAA